MEIVCVELAAAAAAADCKVGVGYCQYAAAAAVTPRR